MGFLLAMQNFAEIHLKPQALARHGLPDIAYPVPAADLQVVLADDGELPLAVMLHSLQQRSRDGEADWQQIEAAMDRLAHLLAPDEDREVISAAGDNWRLEIGPVDLNAELVTVQRGENLIAAIAAREDGRLRVAVFRPLDAKSTEYLIGLGQVPPREHGVCRRENNWEYALDCSAGSGNFYAADRGEAYLSYWEKGLGISSDGTDVPKWRAQKDLAAREVRRADRAALGRDCRLLSPREQGLLGLRRRTQEQDPHHPAPGLRAARRGVSATEGPDLHVAQALRSPARASGPDAYQHPAPRRRLARYRLAPPRPVFNARNRQICARG